MLVLGTHYFTAYYFQQKYLYLSGLVRFTGWGLNTGRTGRYSRSKSTYVTVVEHLMHVDAFSVEDLLLLARLAGGITEEAARQARGLHEDGVLGQCV